MEAKPWFASKTLWINGLALVASIGATTGFDLGLTAEVQTSIVTGIMALVNIVLRLTTNAPVSVKGPA